MSVADIFNGPQCGNMHKRRAQYYTDQHHRAWWAWVDKANGEPCGLTQPSEWGAPWLPPEQYIQRVEGQQGKVFINYRAWETELKAAHKEYAVKRDQAGVLLHGQAYQADKPSTPQMLQMIGFPPMPIEPVQAMRQGNKFALGITKKVDPRLQKFVPGYEELVEEDFSEPEEDLGEPEVAKPRRGRPPKIQAVV